VGWKGARAGNDKWKMVVVVTEPRGSGGMMMRLAVAGGLWGGESPNYVAPVFHGSTKNKSHRRASYRILAMSGISVIHTLSIRHHPYHTDGKVSLKTSQPTASPATPTPTSPTPPTTPTKPRISRIRTNYCGTRTPTSFRPRPSPLFTRARRTQIPWHKSPSPKKISKPSSRRGSACLSS
jgi:hypothetical protein